MVLMPAAMARGLPDRVPAWYLCMCYEVFGWKDGLVDRLVDGLVGKAGG